MNQRIRQKRFFWIATILFASLVAGLAYAEGGGGHQGKSHHNQKWLEKLDLTDAQTQQIQEIKQSFHSDMKSKRETMHKAKQELKAALKTDASEASLKKQFNELQTMRKDFATARFEKVLAIPAVLTPEQRAKFEGFGRRRHKKPHNK